MSGRKQHHIPQSVLRAFETPTRGRTIKVWVHTKTKKYKSSISDVAAERHFYSELSNDGTETLDDLITAYEGSFGGQLTALRAFVPGNVADAHTAAAVIAHLTIRNAHLRKSFAHGIRLLVSRAIGIFCNETNIRALLGVDEQQFPTHIVPKLDEFFSGDERFSKLGIPREVLHKITLMMLKENFSRLVTRNLPYMQVVLDQVATNAPEQMRSGHNRALSLGLAPDERAAALSKLHWTVQGAPGNGVILPDCVALGVEDGRLPQPLIMCDLGNLKYAVMPLTPMKLLVGSRIEGDLPDLSNFNAHASACSQGFFVSNRDDGDITDLISSFGTRAILTIEEALEHSFEAFRRERNLPSSPRLEIKEANDIDIVPVVDIPLEPLSYQTSFIGVADEATAKKVAATLEGIVRELRPMMALDRLDGFTFAEDYEAALSDLDRGVATSESLVPTQNHGTSMSMALVVIRGSVVKSRIVARMWVANALISEDEDAQQTALHLIISQLAHVACVQLLDEFLPGIFLQPFKNSYDAFLYPCVDCAWAGYFGARAKRSLLT